MKVITTRVIPDEPVQITRETFQMPRGLERHPELRIDHPIPVCETENPPDQQLAAPVSGDPETVAEAVVALFDRMALREDEGIGLAAADYVKLCKWWAKVYAGVESLTAADIRAATSRTRQETEAKVRKPGGELGSPHVRQPAGKIVRRYTEHYPGVDIAWHRYMLAVSNQRGEVR